ncbi:MAG TPA: site-specific DNA-methyltransferase, partial [Phycisphaerae bacterium]|nr:site-specific DNA-methyltransferase [Phycisphaerae bacterium]
AGADHEAKCKSVVGLDSDRNRTVYSNWNGPRTDASGKGRWPANLLLDEAAAELLDEQSGVTVSTGGQASLGAFRDGAIYGKGRNEVESRDPGKGDTGGASRFFYVAKPSTAEREGEDLPLLGLTKTPIAHPTMKPVDLMRYLVRLVTPRGGVVLDPFMGSGTTGMAAGREGFDFIGIEREAEYFAIAQGRIGL